MSGIPTVTFLNFCLFLLIPFLFAFLLQKKNISPIIGYIIGGVVLSNVFGSLISKEAINSFAYFGIILLLFTIGLEIQFDQIINMKRFIVLGGFLQIIFSIVCIAGTSMVFGFSFLQSFLVGIALSSSSTSLVAKIIQDRGEEGSFLGELAMGILMFQDLAFIPFMIIFASLTSKSFSLLQMGGKIAWDMVFSILILWVAYYFGRKIIPIVFERIALVSRELLNLFIVVFIFFIAYISNLLGIPIFVSIFVAGILISQTLEHYHIFSQIRPLRDLLAVIFFIYIGTNVNVGLILPFAPMIFLFTLCIIFLKAVIVLIIFLFFRFNSRLSFYLSIYLFQVDEDAFILMSLAYINGLFREDQYLFIITAALLSLIVTPILINSKELLYFSIRNIVKKYLPFLHTFIKYRIDFNQSPIDELHIKDHVVICGYGRMGSSIGRALMLANIPFVAIDYNFHTVRRAKKEGITIIYGDPTDSDILDYAEIESAFALVLALPDRFSQEAILLSAKKLNPRIVIMSRVHRKKDHKRMRDLGIKIVIQPEFEASLAIIKRLFLMKNISKDEIIRKIQHLKREEEGI